MEQEIKIPLFRAQSVFGTAVFGGVYEQNYKNFKNYFVVDRKGNEFRIDPKTLSEFTGFNDKKDHKIFTKDNLRYDGVGEKFKKIGTVSRMDDGCFVVEFPSIIGNGVEVYPISQIAKESIVSKSA